MVCIPCFIIPVLLYVWHKFVQPILLKYWNPWEKKEAIPELSMDCTGGACKLVAKKKIDNNSDANQESAKSKCPITGRSDAATKKES